MPFGLTSPHSPPQGLTTDHELHGRQIKNTIKIVLMRYENLAGNQGWFGKHFVHS